jgi:hypothetical protein
MLNRIRNISIMAAGEPMLRLLAKNNIAPVGAKHNLSN